MSIKVTRTCPLGSTCEEAVDGEIRRCAWYVEIEGSNPQSGEPIKEWRCAIAWQPILAINQSMETSQVVSSVQSLRNETIMRQDSAIEVIKNAEITKAK